MCVCARARAPVCACVCVVLVSCGVGVRVDLLERYTCVFCKMSHFTRWALNTGTVSPPSPPPPQKKKRKKKKNKNKTNNNKEQKRKRRERKNSNRMTASVLKQDPDTRRFKRTLIYFNTDTQYAHFGRNPLYQATK